MGRKKIYNTEEEKREAKENEALNTIFVIKNRLRRKIVIDID